MLADGDRILVGLSGGTDSMLCLWFLRHWLQKAPLSYRLFPVYLDMGFRSHAWYMLHDYINSLCLPLHMEETDYGIVAHDERNRGKSPCFVCSMKRRKRLFELADIMGCNKIALGHNLDDLIETFFINILYTGETSTMHPCQEMFKGKITLIRPLSLVEKKKVTGLAAKLRLPNAENPCPSAGYSKRTEIRNWIEQLSQKDPSVRGNVRRAMGRIKREYLL